jgi:hypothetical protein
MAVDEEERGGAELPQAVTAAASTALAAAASRPRVRMDFLGVLTRAKRPGASVGVPKLMV